MALFIHVYQGPIHTCIHIYLCIYIHIYRYMYVYMYMYIYTCIYILISSIYVSIYIHIYISKDFFPKKKESPCKRRLSVRKGSLADQKRRERVNRILKHRDRPAKSFSKQGRKPLRIETLSWLSSEPLQTEPAVVCQGVILDLYQAPPKEERWGAGVEYHFQEI